MPNNPYDEILRSIARILEHVLGEDGETPRIVGCAIFACGGPRDDDQNGEKEKDGGFAYEMTGNDQCVYISAAVPPKYTGRASVAFGPHAVALMVGEYVEKVDLDDEIDPDESSFSVNHGVLDVVCVKTQKTEPSQ